MTAADTTPAAAAPAEPFAERFDGNAYWAKVRALEQRRIGIIALELAVCLRANDASDKLSEVRPFEHGISELLGRLEEAAEEALGEDFARFEENGFPVPLLLGQVCRRCGCSYTDPCDDEEVGEAPCGWAEENLCTACAARAAAEDEKAETS